VKNLDFFSKEGMHSFAQHDNVALCRRIRVLTPPRPECAWPVQALQLAERFLLFDQQDTGAGV
jgi:hypothetical protein